MSKLILAFGDSIRSQTGYGKVSQNVFKHFLRNKYTMMQIGWQHAEPPERTVMTDKSGIIGSIDVWPPHTFDENHTMSTVMHINGFKPHFVYNSNDIFTSTLLVKSRPNLRHPMFLINYGVIDAPDAAEWFKETIEGIDVTVTPSKFGYERLKKITDKGLYIPHGVDLDTFKPADNQELIKQKFGVGGKFVYGGVHRNITRKLIPFVIQSFANLKYKHKLKDISLFLVMDPSEAHGYDISTLCKYYNLTWSWDTNIPGDVHFHPEHLNYTIGLSEAGLAETYNMCDVLVSATMSEGFGLPTLEAQACGTPMIISDHSANTELVEGHGWLCPIAKNSDGSDVLFPFNMSAGGERIMYGYPVPDQVAIENAMLDAYNNSSRREAYGKAAADFAKQYDWNKILPLWDEPLRRADEFWEKQKGGKKNDAK